MAAAPSLHCRLGDGIRANPISLFGEVILGSLTLYSEGPLLLLLLRFQSSQRHH